MAVRRSLAKELDTPRQRRRSLRLAGKKGTPFGSAACHRSTSSTFTNLATPRTLLRKVLQTQPIVSPLVPEKRDSPKPVETVPELPSGTAPHSTLELSLSDPAPKYTSRATYLNARTKKKVRLSEFERVLDKQVTSNTAASLSGNTSLTRSLQISFATPVPLENAEKRGLIRRPKNYRSVDVKAFEEGIEQNLLQIKGSQCHLVNLQATSLLSNDTEVDLTATELFAQPQLSGQGGSGHSVFPSQLASTRKSSQRQQSMLPFIQTPPQDAKFDVDVQEVTRTEQKKNLTAESGCADGTEAAPEETAASSREEQQDGLQGAEGGLKCSDLKKATPGTDDAGRMDTGSQATKALTPERGQQDSDMEQFLNSGDYLVSGIGTARTSTPAGVQPPQVHPGNLSSLIYRKTSKRSVKEMVTHILKELDSSMAPATVSQGGSESRQEKELPPQKGAMQISQRTEAGPPGRRGSRKDSEQFLRPAAREMVDEQAGCSGEVGEAEDDVVSNTEIDPEADKLMEVETEWKTVDPTEKTPAFVHIKAFNCTPLLATPHFLKVSASKNPVLSFVRQLTTSVHYHKHTIRRIAGLTTRDGQALVGDPSSGSLLDCWTPVRSSLKQPPIKRVPKQTERVEREKRESSLPSSLVKRIFSHYARMPVSKDAFKAVERCVNLYFKRLCDDLEVYTYHAGRKTTEPADVELLMRRQGLITDKMPLNVLIERYMPLAYRKLLIPIATSGNKVVPPKLR